MPLYTFYCRRSDGTAVSFETVALAGDAAAKGWLDRVLHGHASCDYVEVFQDDRLVATHRRAA